MSKTLKKIWILLLFVPFLMACVEDGGDFKRNRAVYITTKDGVRVAADIWFPAEIQQGVRVPSMVRFTRYWRAVEMDPLVTDPDREVDYFNRNGFAYVIVDVRGTGASFGTRKSEFTVAETRDYSDVINWIADQNWSNGDVSTIGISYDGNTAENATYDAPAPLKAAIPRFVDFDIYASILFPGGLQNLLITGDWGRVVRGLDLNDAPSLGRPGLVGVKPVDEDTDRTLLKQAVEEHRANPLVTDIFGPVIFRDDLDVAVSLGGAAEQSVSPHNFRSAVEHKAIPAYHWGSWMDAGTAAGILSRFASYDAPARYVIGPWSHGAGHDVDPFKPKDTPVLPSVDDQYRSISEFLSLSGTKIPKELYYFTFGEGKWKKTKSWPPVGTTSRRFYFSEGGALDEKAPQAINAVDQYRVNFDAGSGDLTRWDTQLGGKDVFYGDRAAADKLNLTYTSAPLTEDMEFTGHGVVHLKMSSSTPDGAVIVYVEDVAPDGTVTMITEGHLRLLHRKISDEVPPYPVFGPYHSFLKKDALPMMPGKRAEVSFVLLPTSVLLKKGHAMRVSISGHDKDTFMKVPENATPLYSFYRQADAASFIEIPVQAPGSSGESVNPFTQQTKNNSK